MTIATAIIVSRTRMSGSFCVGAYDVDNRRNIRLLTPEGYGQNPDFPLQILDVVRVNYTNRAQIIPPHTEDVHLHDYERLTGADVEAARATFRQTYSCVTGPLSNCFGGKLVQPLGAAFAIGPESVSDHSVCFWQTDAPLTKSRWDGKYDYVSGRIRTSIKYVGFPERIDVIPPNTIVRMSLSRWFDPNQGDNKCCWLQLSGWY